MRELTGGRGADIVLEVSGAAPALNKAIRIAGFGARVVAMSWYGGTFETLSLTGEFHHNRVRISSSQVGAVNPDLGPLWSSGAAHGDRIGGFLHQLPLAEYITHEFEPSQAAEAYAMIDERRPDVLQCVFRYAGAD